MSKQKNKVNKYVCQSCGGNMKQIDDEFVKCVKCGYRTDIFEAIQAGEKKRKMVKSCEGCKYRFGYIKASELKRNCDKVCINFNRYKPTPPVLANSQERGKKPEVKKNCENCLYQEAYILCDNCTDDDFNWQPKQESVVVEIKRTNLGVNFVYVEQPELEKLIPRGSTRKFRLIPVED